MRLRLQGQELLLRVPDREALYVQGKALKSLLAVCPEATCFGLGCSQPERFHTYGAMTESVRDDISRGLKKLADGDRSEVNATFDRLWPVVHGFCDRFLNHSPLSEDAAQNALLKVFERAHSFDGQKDGLTWVLTLAAWECRTVRKRQHRESSRNAELRQPVSSQHDPEETLALQQALGHVAKLWQMLPSDCQATLSAALSGQKGGSPALRKRKQRAIGQLRRWWEMFRGRV